MEKGSNPSQSTPKEAEDQLSIVCHHKLAISKDRYFGRGDVIGWSEHGLRILSSVPVDEALEHKVRFHVQKIQGLMGTARLITREGKVSWVQEQKQRWLVGIELEGTVEKLDEYITQEDSCYLFFMPTD